MVQNFDLQYLEPGHTLYERLGLSPDASSRQIQRRIKSVKHSKAQIEGGDITFRYAQEILLKNKEVRADYNSQIKRSVISKKWEQVSTLNRVAYFDNSTAPICIGLNLRGIIAEEEVLFENMDLYCICPSKHVLIESISEINPLTRLTAIHRDLLTKDGKRIVESNLKEATGKKANVNLLEIVECGIYPIANAARANANIDGEFEVNFAYPITIPQRADEWNGDTLKKIVIFFGAVGVAGALSLEGYVLWNTLQNQEKTPLIEISQKAIIPAEKFRIEEITEGEIFLRNDVVEQKQIILPVDNLEKDVTEQDVYFDVHSANQTKKEELVTAPKVQEREIIEPKQPSKVIEEPLIKEAKIFTQQAQDQAKIAAAIIDSKDDLFLYPNTRFTQWVCPGELPTFNDLKTNQYIHCYTGAGNGEVRVIDPNKEITSWSVTAEYTDPVTNERVSQEVYTIDYKGNGRKKVRVDIKKGLGKKGTETVLDLNFDLRRKRNGGDKEDTLEREVIRFILEK